MAVFILGPGNDVVNGTKRADQILLGAGSDSALGDGGADTIFGDKADLVAVVDDATFVTITFDDDNMLNGEGGNDVIYGDTAKVQVSAQGVGTSGIVSSENKIFNFGDEIPGTTEGIFGGGGNDILYGDLSDIILTAKGADNFTATANNQGRAIIEENRFNFGNDLLEGGSGKDTIYGDLKLIELIATGGSGLDAVSFIAVGRASIGETQLNVFNFGNDDLFGEAGSDVLLGDMESLLLEATGGTSVDSSSGILAGSASILQSVFDFGNDELDGGANSDTIYGDLISIEFTAKGGTQNIGGGLLATTAQAAVFGNIIAFGADTIHGGSAADTLFGDLSDLTLTAQPGGPAPVGAALIVFNNFIFGNDTIMGDAGSDTIYGDFFSLQPVSPIASVTIPFGNVIRATDGDNNTFDFGNDDLFGGGGRDTFSFTLLPFDSDVTAGDDSMIMQGNDRLLDFNSSKDTIEFRDVIDLDGDGDADIDDLALTTIIVENVDVDGDTITDDLLIQFRDSAANLIGSIGIVDPPALPGVPTIVDLAGVINIDIV